jgi:hypothetical protein
MKAVVHCLKGLVLPILLVCGAMVVGVLLPFVGVFSDTVQFSKLTSLALSLVIICALIAVYRAATMDGRGCVVPLVVRLVFALGLCLPIGLWHLMSLAVLWYWNTVK